MADIKALSKKMSEQAQLKKHKLTPRARLLHDCAVQLEQKACDVAAVIAERRALAMCPESPFIMNGLGAILWDLGEFEEAELRLTRAHELDPLNFFTPSNLAKVCSSTNRPADSRRWYEIAKKITPGGKEMTALDWNFAMSGCLAHGAWKEGFDLYECRTEHAGQNYYPKYSWPRWNGEPLDGKTIFIQAEQGVGDRILFSRYLHWLKETWPTCKIKFTADAADLPPLTNLLWEFSEIIEFIPGGVPTAKDVDYYAFLMSLPKFHGTTIDNVPPDPGLILARASRELQLLANFVDPNGAAFKVGVCWSGNPVMARNAVRSIPFEMMLELETIPEVQLYSFQFGAGHADIERVGAAPLIFDIAKGIDNRGLVGSAACMLKMDLIITCCTATAHLAGALGIPTWVLLCADPYWVWLREREDSVWYPSVRLIRQTKMNDWRGVIDRVMADLRPLAQAHLADDKAA